MTEKELRARRVQVEKEIAELIAQQQDWYINWVKPNAAEAKMSTTGGKAMGKAGATTKVLPLELADQIDTSTPTGKFEKGRTYIEHISGKVARLRTEDARLRDEIDLMVRERHRRRGLGRAETYLERHFREALAGVPPAGPPPGLHADA